MTDEDTNPAELPDLVARAVVARCLSDDELREVILLSVRRRGVKATARCLGLTPEPITRLAGRLPVQRGTIAQARANVWKLEQ